MRSHWFFSTSALIGWNFLKTLIQLEISWSNHLSLSNKIRLILNGTRYEHVLSNKLGIVPSEEPNLDVYRSYELCKELLDKIHDNGSITQRYNIYYITVISFFIRYRMHFLRKVFSKL